MLVRANKACSVCLGSKLDRADVMRGRLGAIRAAAPTVFRYCCARGIQNPPAGPAKKLQWFEFVRLSWRRYSVCSKWHCINALVLVDVRLPRLLADLSGR
jgi:hypothetical protein